MAQCVVRVSGPFQQDGRQTGNALVRKLGKYAALTDEDRHALERLCQHSRRHSAKETLIHEDTQPGWVYLVVSGIAYRFRHLSNGGRQIFGYLLPGDLCDTQFGVASRCDHNVGLLTDCEIAAIPIFEFRNAIANSRRIEHALVRAALIEAAILREWLINVGQRNALQRLAHFSCEFTERLIEAGEALPNCDFRMPITQLEVADTLGLTVVHVNRCLQQLRRMELIDWSRGRLAILDRCGLEALAGFERAYLGLRDRSPDAPGLPFPIRMDPVRHGVAAMVPARAIAPTSAMTNAVAI